MRRSKLSDVQNLYVYSSQQNGTKIPLVQVSNISNSMMTDRIVRIDHFREMSILRLPCRGTPGVGDYGVRPAQTRRVREDDAPRLQDHHRRRV